MKPVTGEVTSGAAPVEVDYGYLTCDVFSVGEVEGINREGGLHSRFKTVAMTVDYQSW